MYVPSMQMQLTSARPSGNLWGMRYREEEKVFDDRRGIQFFIICESPIALLLMPELGKKVAHSRL